MYQCDATIRDFFHIDFVGVMKPFQFSFNARLYVDFMTVDDSLICFHPCDECSVVGGERHKHMAGTPQKKIYDQII